MHRLRIDLDRVLHTLPVWAVHVKAPDGVFVTAEEVNTFSAELQAWCDERDIELVFYQCRLAAMSDDQAFELRMTFG